ncbi:ubiquitin carboxyl-terminal hydrolase 40 [Discoglossus pictus]
MFGDLFEEEDDFSFLSISPRANGRKPRHKDSEIPHPRGPTKLSGLRNQGGTCYLNSLLQTLLYTPEFREALFALGPEELGSLEDKDVPDSKVRVIPLQLQRLFAQLLLLDQQATSTSDLTNSFGWNSNEAAGQHDVQELNRILFSALESSLEGTSGHNLIQQLYHGVVVNSIKCQECGHVSERQEDFLDVTVAVKGMCSLEESLCNMYLEEELFEGDNLYHCGACDRLVPAAKSAKLGKLPLFLTVSLLRFNFDFSKCERYKETSRYTFPSRLNLRPFCEQNHLEDSSDTYDLFSVIIHKGGCYGGHYHVYIRDVDELGQWDCKETAKVSAGAGDAGSDPDGPAVTLASVIAESGMDRMVPVDQLGQKLLEHTGASWNKTYRKEHGSIRKFLQSNPSIFQLSSDGSLVGLAQTEPGMEASDRERSARISSERPPVSQSSCSHWFDFNDSTVQPIQETDIERQFQGKESAYMLFYRQSRLQRPREAKTNCRFGVPEHLLQAMDQVNVEWQRKRLASDTERGRMELRVHLSSGYQYVNCALHPIDPKSFNVLEITAPQGGTVGDLKSSIFQVLDGREEGQVLSIVMALPAGLHVFQDLRDSDQDLTSAGVKDGGDLFLWDGKQVGGLAVPSGELSIPLLLTIMRPSGSSDPLHPYTESPGVFLSNTCFSDMQRVLLGDSPSQDSLLCYQSAESSGSWSVCPPEDMSKTLKELGLRDGSCLLLKETRGEGEVTAAPDRGSVQASEQSTIQVQDWRQPQDPKQVVQIPITPSTLMSDIHIKSIAMLGPLHETGVDTCLRPQHRSGKLLPPVPGNITVQEAGLKAGSIMGLCRGRIPSPTQIFLYFLSENDLQDGREQEIILEGTLTVRECLARMLQEAGLSAASGWHLRKTDWCYEAGDPLSDEDATLGDLNIQTGDTLVITEGKLPPKGFLKLPIWHYYPQTLQDGVNHMTSCLASFGMSAAGDAPRQDCADSPLYFAGHIEISGDASLQDLKLQVMTLPVYEALGIPSPAFLRIWTLENKHLGKILRSSHQKISEYRLGPRSSLCAEPLSVEECLGPQDLLLRVQLSVPGERRYFPPGDIVWDVSRGCTAPALRQTIAAHCSLPVEKVEIAKHLPDRHEWLPISSWTQQTSKKRKKKPESLKGAPYHLKDGDVIGVKNLLLDDATDFSSETDLIMKGRSGQRKSEKGKRHPQNDHVVCKEKARSVVRKPEAPLSIRVGVFR